MSLNATPRGDRVHIALFGKRNAGKSSIINALTNQDIAVVSSKKGTTTDPVYKAMELLPIGPVVFIDTPGLDDEGELGQLRIEKAYSVLNKADMALLIVDAENGMTDFEKDLLQLIKDKKIPVIGVMNKIDRFSIESKVIEENKKNYQIPFIGVSAKNRKGINDLKSLMIANLPNDEDKFQLVGDLLSPGDFVVLVVPIDKAAPKGRLILPQQQVIRDVLESDATCIVVKEYELKETLEYLKRKPKIVITDSQVFAKVSADTPKDIWLTSFSILFARYKGDITSLVRGAMTIEQLKDGDKILIAEGCTHHRQSDDIGTVKIPRWIRQYTQKEIEFNFSSGIQYPVNIEDYALIVHCGGCMLNKREVMYRIRTANGKEVPIVNYGVLIAYLQGILGRALQPFPLAQYEINGISTSI